MTDSGTGDRIQLHQRRRNLPQQVVVLLRYSQIHHLRRDVADEIAQQVVLRKGGEWRQGLERPDARRHRLAEEIRIAAGGACQGVVLGHVAAGVVAQAAAQGFVFGQGAQVGEEQILLRVVEVHLGAAVVRDLGESAGVVDNQRLAHPQQPDHRARGYRPPWGGAGSPPRRRPAYRAGSGRSSRRPVTVTPCRSSGVRSRAKSK